MKNILPDIEFCKNCPSLKITIKKYVGGSYNYDLKVLSCDKLESRKNGFLKSKTVFYGRLPVEDKDLERMSNVFIPKECDFYLEYVLRNGNYKTKF